MWKYLNKGISTPIAITIILILVIAVGGFTWWQYGEIKDFKVRYLGFEDLYDKEDDEIIEEDNETAGWETYRNQKIGFEFKLPPLGEWEYSISETDWLDGRFRFSEEGSEISFYVRANIFDSPPPIAYFSHYLACRMNSEIVLLGNEINERIWSTYQRSLGSPSMGSFRECGQIPNSFIKNQHSVEVNFCINEEHEIYHPTFAEGETHHCDQEGADYFYNIFLLCKEKSWEGKEGIDKCEQLFKQIMSTFKFIKGGQIIVSTDKNDYRPREDLIITIDNQTEFFLYAEIENYSYSSENYVLRIEEYKGGEWRESECDFKDTIRCNWGGQGPVIACKELKPGKQLKRKKTLSCLECLEGEKKEVPLSPGIYRLKVELGKECLAGTYADPDYKVYSNEFTVSP